MIRLLVVAAAVVGQLLTTALLLAATPATQPAPAPSPTRVLVLPFEPIGPAEQKEWVGQAIQQSLIVELSRMGGIEATASARTGAITHPHWAVAAATDAGAVYAVFGSYQLVGTDLRILGQLVDARSSRTIAGLKATGPAEELFWLQDALAMQAKRAVAAPQRASAASSIEAQASSSTALASVSVATDRPETAQLGIGVYAGEDLSAPLFFAPAVQASTVANRYRYGDYIGLGYPWLGWYGYGYWYRGWWYGPGVYWIP